ncbi:KH domain-containing At4g18375 isoform X1 [Olea europaea subsp. europaea]|uniref:KH domain-containing At4g18375 isoform X1 n=1 Tax=Olea europaea subsp. europaea TaxID=158383 RepID=A0A8S0SM72_OLEEU|nr:KH domain-containing At4g18375 isoform X1 [Olea europaea subsp. europaea]
MVTKLTTEGSHHNDGDIKNLERHLDRERGKDDKGDDELMGYRILCPDGVIGNVIGKSGNVIKSIRQERENVEVDDEFNYKEPLSISGCPPQERNLDRERDKDDKGNDELMGYRILCPDGVIGNVIGKSGNVIKSIRQETRAKAKVLASLPGARDKSCHNLLLC